MMQTASQSLAEYLSQQRDTQTKCDSLNQKFVNGAWCPHTGLQDAKLTRQGDQEAMDRGYRQRRAMYTNHRFANSVGHIIRKHLPWVRSIGDFGASTGEYTRIWSSTFNFAARAYDGTPGIARISRGLVQEVNIASRFNEQQVDVPQHDVAISIEVGEHIPPELTDAYVWNLQSRARIAVFVTWAQVGQTGTGHVNERNAESVEALFRPYGLTRAEGVEAAVREYYNSPEGSLHTARKNKFLPDNLYVFVRNCYVDAVLCSTGTLAGPQ
jgi:hypothetical protein